MEKCQAPYSKMIPLSGTAALIDACSCLTVLGSSSAVQGKGEAKGPKEEEGVGRKHGQGLGGLCSEFVG